MKKQITIIAFLFALTAFSQTAIKKSSIDSGGASVTNGTTSVFYTIGEVAVQEYTQGATHISEGFISKNLLTSLGISDDFSLLEGVNVYPNPSVDFVNISFSDEAIYTLSIFDALGKKIDEISTEKTNLHSINITDFSIGLYMIVIKNQANKQYNTYRIIKE